MYYEIDPKNPRAHGLPHSPLHSLVVPRPIGWISTLGPAGQVNLAPFSFFNAVSERPPAVMVSINGRHREDGGAKDTLANIEREGEFVVNIVTWDLREAMNKTSAPLPHAVGEMASVGLESAPSRKVRPPRVAASPAHLECVYLQTVELPNYEPSNPNFTVFGLVVAVHISESILTDGMVDMKKFRPIARLGYHDYTVVDNFFSMPRPA